MKYLAHQLRSRRLTLRFFKQPLKPLLLGVAIALGGCSSDGIQAVQTIVFGEPDALNIQPIQVCDDSGSRCAGVNFFEDITAKILEQARLKVNFLPINRLNASRFLTIEDSSRRNSDDYEFYELTRTGGAGAFGRNPDSGRTTGPINVWFVEEIETLNGFTQFGLAWINANGVLVSEAALDFGSNGRTDTLAHEIGHNLGLRHTTLGAGGPNNLLTDGDRRNVPGSVNDISPDGAGLSNLTDAQIKTIRNSPFVSQGASGLLPSTEVSPNDQSSDLIAGFGNAFSSADLSIELSPESPPEPAAWESVPEPTIGWLVWSMLGVSLLTATRRAAVVRS